MKVVIVQGVRRKYDGSSSQFREYSGNACAVLAVTGRLSPLVVRHQRRPSFLAVVDSPNGLLRRDSRRPTYAILNLLQIRVE